MYAYRTTTLRLQPFRHYDKIVFRIVFRDKTMSFNEIGYVNITAFEDGLYIEYFEVYMPFRGKGYGTEMYEWIEQYAQQRGARRIMLTPYDSAIGFWRKMGFKLPVKVNNEMIKELR